MRERSSIESRTDLRLAATKLPIRTVFVRRGVTL